MSNLPPGVTVSMIPGNGPEEAELEGFHEAFTEFLDKQAMLVVSDEAFDLLADWIWKIKQDAFSAGYSMGAAEEREFGRTMTAQAEEQTQSHRE